eukprot:COSAG01_NODE_16676_length_1216_cov_1.014324_2_plen_331_part_01
MRYNVLYYNTGTLYRSTAAVYRIGTGTGRHLRTCRVYCVPACQQAAAVRGYGHRTRYLVASRQATAAACWLLLAASSSRISGPGPQLGTRTAHPAVAVASPSSSALRIAARLSGAGGLRRFCLSSAQRVPASPGSLREMMAVGVRLSSVLITAALTFWGRTAYAYMSPMCCGDNFCCAVESTGSVSCWGGNSFDSVTPSGTTLGSLSRISHIACAGKSLVVVNSALQIAAVLGTTGYGADSFPANLIGSTVRDISVSFWGGAFISGSDGSITTWGQDATYSSSTTSQSWYPSSDSSGRGCGCTTAERRMAFTNIPSAGTFSKVACGGKRAG